MERGLSVLALDTGYYRDGWLYSDNQHYACSPQTLNKDLREITEQDLEGCDAVAHLAELSNDPLGQNKPEVTHRINHKGSVSLAEKARAVGIRRFVYTSSCSVYGAGTGDFLDEILRRPIRRPPTPNARSLSNATSARWRGRISAPCSCAMRPRTVRHRACASTSC